MTKAALGTLPSLSIIVNSKLGILRDRTHEDIDEIERWLNEILSQTEEDARILKDRCEICNSKEERKNLELHHIAGRKHDHRTVTACKRCHLQLSTEQGLKDSRWLCVETSINLKTAFFLQGLKDVLILKAQKTGNSHYRDLAISFVSETTQLLRGD